MLVANRGTDWPRRLPRRSAKKAEWFSTYPAGVRIFYSHCARSEERNQKIHAPQEDDSLH